MMVIDNKFEIGDIVYFITDVEQLPRMVTGILVYNETIDYEVSYNQSCCYASEIEISKEKTVW